MSEQISDFVVWVGGNSYTRESLTKEYQQMGACRRVPFVPKGLVTGESRVFLVSDMSDSDRERYKEETKRRFRVRHKMVKEGMEPDEVHITGPMPRGQPKIFAYFVVKSITYIVGAGVDVPKRLKELRVDEYEYVDGVFGFNDERECGSLQIGGTYLLSERDMEKCKDLADSSTLDGQIVIMNPSYTYTEKRFRGIKALPRDAGDRWVVAGSGK